MKQTKIGNSSHHWLTALGIIALLTGSCYYKSSPVAGSATVINAARLTTNVLDGRVDAYDAALDYFPDKVAFRHATQLKLEYHKALAMMKDRELGVNRVGMAEHLEPTPLAKSEWIKFFALFFNREKIANEKFDEIERSYNETRAKVQEKLARVSYRPKVLVNYRSGGSWQVYGGLNAFARLIGDAGGDYLFKDLPYLHSLYEMPFEAVYDKGAEADVWIVGPDLSSQFADGKLRFDERLKKLKASQNFFVSYNPTKEKRNPWWDQALINPHVELLDYVKAIHPELVPEHELKLLRQIKAVPAN